MADKLTEKGKRKIKSRMTGGDSTGILFPNVYSGEKKKTKPKKKVGGRAKFRGGGRTDLLEELGRVEGEHSNRNRRAEVSRIHGELNKGYKGGKRVGLKHGTSAQQHYLQHGYGPTKVKLRSGKPKIAKKGWA